MWHDFKMILLEGSTLNPALLHICAGLVAFVLALTITRRAGTALLIVLVLQAGNEALDVTGDLAASLVPDPVDALADTLSTLSLPTLLTLVWTALGKRPA